MTWSRARRTESRRVAVVDDTVAREHDETLASEEPLELRLESGSERSSASITMRTPGNDFELAAGYFFAEGALEDRSQIETLTYCLDERGSEQEYNVVTLRARTLVNVRGLVRHTVTASGCGVCGRESIDALRERCRPIDDDTTIDVETLYALPNKMREEQAIFRSTGGLHAAAIFTARGRLLVLREDVGRHNALDKAVGWGLLNARLPFSACIALVSGRASFELVQKAIVARIPVLCAVSAPSTLAVSLADAFGLTLVAFLRDRRCTIYTHAGRVLSGIRT